VHGLGSLEHLNRGFESRFRDRVFLLGTDPAIGRYSVLAALPNVKRIHCYRIDSEWNRPDGLNPQ